MRRAIPIRPFIPVARWRDARHRLGWRGEEVAAAFLVACGFEVEHRRFRVGRHEIDLVVRCRSLVVFVEVKTRRSVVCGAPVESVNARRCRRLGQAAQLWCARYGRPSDTYRFDLVAMEPDGRGGLAVAHVMDAWRL
jgi:putative endonuclease